MKPTLFVVVIWSFCLGWMSYVINVTFVFPVLWGEKLCCFPTLVKWFVFFSVSSLVAWCQSWNKKLHICLLREIDAFFGGVKCYGLHWVCWVKSQKVAADQLGLLTEPKRDDIFYKLPVIGIMCSSRWKPTISPFCSVERRKEVWRVDKYILHFLQI